MYSKQDFGKDLEEQVHIKYDIEYLSDWAHDKYVKNRKWTDRETDRAMMEVMVMAEGDQFAMTKDQILELAKKLQC